MEKSSVQYNGETANEKLRYTYNTVGVDADGLWITLHSRMDKSEVQTMQDVAIDANAILGLVQNILPTYHGSPPSPLSGPKR